jgi:hypothetical protein
MRTAKGTSVPNLEPVEFFKKQDGCVRMTIDKAFEGDLEGRSYGEMLSSMGLPEGNAGYVAIERFKGSLHAKNGSFSLMHYGRMENGSDSLVLEVVPGTGTGDLAGIKGSMLIIIDSLGRHSYIFEYDIV